MVAHVLVVETPLLAELVEVLIIDVKQLPAGPTHVRDMLDESTASKRDAGTTVTPPRRDDLSSWRTIVKTSIAIVLRDVTLSATPVQWLEHLPPARSGKARVVTIHGSDKERSARTPAAPSAKVIRSIDIVSRVN